MKNLFTNVIYTVCFLFLLGANNTVSAQTADAKFLIVIQTTDNGAILNCLEGCEFKNLSISLEGAEPVIVNNDGKTSLINDLAMTTADAIPSGYFLFSVHKTEEGVLLKGRRGVSWETLNFEHIPDVPQAFNQDGMAY